MKKDRFEAFTDGVLAIILTILVLDIHLNSNNHSLKVLINVLPEFAAYIVSFIIIAVMWVNHHYLFLRVKRINHKMIYINILLLFWATILPATTAWFGSDIESELAALLYATNVLFYNLAFLILIYEVQRSNDYLQRKVKYGLISVLFNVLTVLIVFIWPPFILISLLLDVTLWAIQPMI